MTAKMTRRSTFATAAAAAGMAAAPQAVMAKKNTLDLGDPVKALEARVKMMGSIANEPVYSFMRLNVYADPHNGNFVPLFTMNNLLIDRWEKINDEQYALTKFEAGYYTEFDSDKVIEYLDNPFTGERVKIFNFQLGPIQREYHTDEVIAMAYAPNPLPLEVIGDRIFLATQSMGESQSLFPPDEYPIETSGGGGDYLNSFMTWSALYDDVANPDIASAPVHIQIQNKLPWAPWMRMRGRPGGTCLRGFGSKLASLEDLPPGVYEGFEKYVPAILQPGQWEEVVFESFDYLNYLEKERAQSGGR